MPSQPVEQSDRQAVTDPRARVAAALLTARAKPRGIRHTMHLLRSLRALGWQRSVRERCPVDAGGGPVPWMNYAAISALDSLVAPGSRVFEYGCGHSSVWLAARAGSVHAVDHSRDWADRVADMTSGQSHVSVRWIPCSGDALEAPPDDAYVNSPLAVAEVGGFDVVIVDGVARRSCLQVAGRCLADEGVVVLDDAERPAYAAARRAMIDSGRFREVVVRGPKPTLGTLSSTSFFFRRP